MTNSEWFFNAFVERWGNLSAHHGKDMWLRWADSCDRDKLEAAVNLVYEGNGRDRPNLLAMRHAYDRVTRKHVRRGLRVAPDLPGECSDCNGTGKVWIVQGRNHPSEPWRVIVKADKGRKHYDETRCQPHPCECPRGKCQNDIIYPMELPGYDGIVDQCKKVIAGWRNYFTSSSAAKEWSDGFKQGDKHAQLQS